MSENGGRPRADRSQAAREGPSASLPASVGTRPDAALRAVRPFHFMLA